MFPVFCIVIVYAIVSPKSFNSLLLLSVTTAVLTTFIDPNSTIVWSSSVLPSVSSPLSEVSLMAISASPVAVATTEFNIDPLSKASWVIIYEAL